MAKNTVEISVNFVFTHIIDYLTCSTCSAGLQKVTRVCFLCSTGSLRGLWVKLSKRPTVLNPNGNMQHTKNGLP